MTAYQNVWISLTWIKKNTAQAHAQLEKDISNGNLSRCYKLNKDFFPMG